MPPTVFSQPLPKPSYPIFDLAVIVYPYCGIMVLYPEILKEVMPMGSVIKKRRKKIARHKHRKLLKRTRWKRRNK